MDPITITASTFAVLASIKKIVDKVATFVVEAGKIHETIADLKGELYSLYSDIDNVHNICQDPDFAAAATASPGTPQSNIFTRLHANLANCSYTVNQLNDKIAKVDDGGNSFVDRGLTKFRLDGIAEDLEQIRKQIQTHRGSMHLSVTALTFCLQSHSIKLEERAGRLINIKMNRLTNVVELQSSELNRLRERLTSEKEQGQKISDEDTLLLQDMEDIHESTVHITRKATILIESQKSNTTGEPSFEPVVANKLEESVAVNDGIEDNVLQPVLQRGVTAPERVLASSQHDFKPHLPQRVASTPSASTHDLQAVDRLISSEEFEDAVSSTIADAVREKSDPAKPFKEEDFIRIGELLCQVGKLRWAERPRTYLVLRMINEVQAMDGFVLEGLKDIHFPYTEELLPNCLASPSSRYGFINKQSLVMSIRAVDLVRGGPHRHFNKSPDIHFTFVRNLGQGGQGTVVLVKSHLSSQVYAHKKIIRTRIFAKNKQTLAMFEQEIHNLKRLEHIHLVKLVGSYTDPKYVGLIMDPAADIDLKRYLAAGPFQESTMNQLRCFFGCLASAMRYLHDQNCRHKDIKPSNILIKGETVLITDFGTSLDWTELEADTTDGRPAAFTNTYAAPEVAQARPRKTSADIWSLGCVFLEMTSVLKGICPDERKRFFEKSHTCSTCFHDNQDAVSDWIQVLSDKAREDQASLDWIKRMVVDEPSARMQAGDLFNEILSFDGKDRYYGPCCGTIVESANNSWHGSDSEEDSSHDTSSATKSSSASHTLTWSSLDQPLTPGRAEEKRMNTSGESKSAKMANQSLPERSAQVLSITKRRAYGGDIAHSLRDPLTPPHERNAKARMSVKSTEEPADLADSPVGHQPRESRVLSPLSSPIIKDGVAPDIVSNLSSSGRVIREYSDIPKASKDSAQPSPKDGPVKEYVDEKKHGVYHLPKPRHPLPFRRKIAAKPRAAESPLFIPNNPGLESYLQSLWAKKDGQLQTYVIMALESDDKDEIRTTPLHIAIRLKDPTLSRDIVKLIVDKSDLVNIADLCLNTPLHLAIACNRLLIVKHLLSHGADISQTNSWGQNAVHIAVRMHSPSILSILLRQKSSPVINAKDDRRRTPLHLACARGYTDLVSILLDHDAALDPIETEWRNPNLHEKENAYEEINALLEQARDSRCPDTEESASDPTSEPTIPYHDLTAAAKSDGSSGWIETCHCEVCKLLDVSTKMGESELEIFLHCKCRDCLDRLATHTISDHRLVKGTLDVCSCVACANSKSATHIPREKAGKDSKPEPKGDIDESVEYSSTSFDYATIDDTYEAELLAQKNRPPCECTECSAKRLLECEKVLSEGRFKKYPYRERATKVLEIIIECMSRRIKLAANMEDIVLVLLNQGADIEINWRNASITEGFWRGVTILDIAVEQINIPLVQLLLNRGAQYDKRISHAPNVSLPLSGTVDPTTAYLLLRYGASVDTCWSLISTDRRWHHSDKTLFRLSITMERASLFQVFMRYGPNLEFRTPLHDAIIATNIEKASMLLDAGASLNKVRSWYNGALYHAILSRSLPIVRLVLTYIDPFHIHGQCGNRTNALMVACFNGGHAILAELLSTTGAVSDIAETDGQGRTCLHLFAEGSQARAEIGAMLDLLVTQSGAALDAKDTVGNTPLHLAVMAGNFAVVQGLMDKGAYEHARNRQGDTPLDLAKRKRNREMVTVLGGELKKRRWYEKI